MKYFKIGILLFIAVSVNFAKNSWSLDKAHTKVAFSATHLVISQVEGRFDSYDGKIITDGDDFENASIEFSADVYSINTDNEKRDKHLKSDVFFNAEKFPKITFKSESFRKTEDNNYKLVGDLTIRDITKKVTLDAKLNGIIEDPWGNTRVGFTVSGVENRFDFGLKWNAMLETGGLVVGKDIILDINLELIKDKI